ncbi:MAG: prenyltransferase [Bacteroidales bacterium]|nr:prenyltransferase [Bacteroidales bacterium]
MNNVKVWMAQIRAPFLILSVFLVLIGLALSLKYPMHLSEDFNYFHAILLVIGVVSSHISVNLFNEYSDYFTRIDFKTVRTPFSGGSGMMTSGKSKPGAVLTVAIITLIFSLIIGIYFSLVSNWIILLFAFLGTISIVFYTNFLARYMLGELFAGLALGSLVVLGTYISMNASPAMSWNSLLPVEVIWLSVPAGILTSLLLLINEFPDVEADKAGGRKHLVIRLGWKGAAYVYALGMFSSFGIILVLPLVGLSSFWIYLALLPLPLAIKASLTALKDGADTVKLIPALGANVITVLAFDLLLAVGLFIEMM